MTSPLLEPLDPRRLLSATNPAHPTNPGLLVNAGGPPALDAIARDFQADAGFFTGGRTDIAPAGDVAGTLDDTLHRQHRIGTSFSFTAAVPDGNYVLFLTFTEPTLSAGERSFDVSAEGAVVLDSFDIAAAAEGPMVALATAAEVTVADGELNLTFTGKANSEAIVSGIVLAPIDVPEEAKPYTLAPPGEAGDAVLEVRSASSLRQIIQGIQVFAIDSPRFSLVPDDLQTLVEQDYLDATTLFNPRAGPVELGLLLSELEDNALATLADDYLYLPQPGQSLNEFGPQDPVVYEDPDQVAGDVILMAMGDGSVQQFTRAEAGMILGITIGPPANPPAPREQVMPRDSMINDATDDLRQLMQAAIQIAIDDTRSGLFPSSIGDIAASTNLPADTFVSERTGTATPNDWSDLTPEERRTWVDTNSDYVFPAAGLRATIPPDRLTMYENPAKLPADAAPLTPVAFADGSARVVIDGLGRQLINATAPLTIRSVDYAFNGPQPELRLNANRYVGESLIYNVASITAFNESAEVPLDLGEADAFYDDLTQSIVYRFATPPADGDYRVDVPALALTGGDGVFNRKSAGGTFFVLAGDADRDRRVSLADFGRLRANFGQAGTFSQGDFNYDGVVNLADFGILRANFGRDLDVDSLFVG